MKLQTPLMGSWEKMELWGHTHLALFGIFIMVYALEVILLRITTSARLFAHSHHYDPSYDDSGEYEEDIYYEELSAHYDHWPMRQMHFHHTQHENQLLQQQQQQAQHFFNDHNHSTDEFNHDNNYQSPSTDVFRFVY